jgi:F-type H+-transporting ATPase subunit beta
MSSPSIASPTTRNSGVVTYVRGSVVDVRFDGDLPPIFSVLRTGQAAQIVIEVLAHRDDRRYRPSCPQVGGQ